MKAILALFAVLCFAATADAQFNFNNTLCLDCAIDYAQCISNARLFQGGATDDVAILACFDDAFSCYTNSTGCNIPLPTTTTVEPTTTESCDHIMDDCFQGCSTVRKLKKKTKCELNCAFPEDGNLPSECGACISSNDFSGCLLFCGKIYTCGDVQTTLEPTTTTGAEVTTAAPTTAPATTDDVTGTAEEATTEEAATTGDDVTGTAEEATTGEDVTGTAEEATTEEATTGEDVTGTAEEATTEEATTAADAETTADEEETTAGAPADCPAYRPCRCKPNAFPHTVFDDEGCASCRCKRNP